MGERIYSDNSGPDEQLAEVIDLRNYTDSIDRIDPRELSDQEILEFVLARATHMAVRNDAQRTAHALLELLSDTSEDSGGWSSRAKALKVDVNELDDEEYDRLSQDEVIKQALAVIRSKNGHYKGNESVVAATREVINLRGGILMRAIGDQRLDKWSQMLENLSRPSDV